MIGLEYCKVLPRGFGCEMKAAILDYLLTTEISFETKKSIEEQLLRIHEFKATLNTATANQQNTEQVGAGDAEEAV